MLLEKGRISNSQLSILVIGFVAGSSVILPPGGSAGHDAWIAVALGLMEGLLIAWIFTALARQFGGKTIIEINALVYGQVLGKCISGLFIWYLFHLGAMVLNNFGGFFKVEIYPFTPKAVILLLLMLVCASTVSRGIEVLARISLILVTLMIVVFTTDILLTILHMNLNNLLPIMDISAGKLLWASHSTACFPFAETVAFLMIFAFIDNPKNSFSATARGLLIIGFLFLNTAIRNAAVLGQMTLAYNYPSYMAVQMIDIGDILTRLEVLVAITLVTMGFIKISILFYGTVLGLGQVFNLQSYHPLLLPVGILMVILAMTNVGNTIEMIDFAFKGYSIYAVPFQIGIPLITLVVAKLRKLPFKGDV